MTLIISSPFFFPITEMKLLDASVCRIKYVCCYAITFSLFNPFFHVELFVKLNSVADNEILEILKLIAAGNTQLCIISEHYLISSK